MYKSGKINRPMVSVFQRDNFYQWSECSEFGRHLGTAQCAKRAERKRRRLAETETRDNLERVFHAYGKPMEAISEFQYLWRLLTATDDD